MKNKKTSGKRVFLSVLCIVLALVLTVLLGITIYAKYLLGKLNRVDPNTQPTLSQEELDAYLATEETDPDASDSTAPTVNPEDVVFDEHTTQIGGKGSDVVNILLIGQDRRDGESRARSDSMILCTFNKKTKTLTMTSFLRDLYVQIPGYMDNRINAAYAAGGMTLLNETLEKNFGIHIDGNVEVDFSQFQQIVDLLGGVEMELRQDEANYINQKTYRAGLTAGTQTLDGEQALWYARIRYLDADADFSRTNRQRKVINALIQEYKSSSLSTILGLLDEILPMITTDMTDSEIISYATELFPLLSDTTIVSQRIPADGEYSPATIREMSVLLADMDAARALLEESIMGSSEAAE